MATPLSLKLSDQQVNHLRELLATPSGRWAAQVVERLQAAGFEAYWAGGSVRDLLLGRRPKDFDVATSASVEEVESLFAKTIGVGRQFGIVVAVENEQMVEVSRFREDGQYEDGRRPSQVQFSDASRDASRRDFTINALFLDLKNQLVIDYVGGLADLKQKTLRAVGDAQARFAEDHLRILRALRFWAQLEFTLAPDLKLAIVEKAASVSLVSRERFFKEWDLLLPAPGACQVMEFIDQQNLFAVFWPDLRLAVRQWQELPSGTSSWLRFWLACFLSGTSEEMIFQKQRELKTSRLWLKEMEAGLQWFFHSHELAQKPVGALLALLQEDSAWQGLQIFLQVKKQTELPPWPEVCRLRQSWQGHWPEALLTGKDLVQQVQGERLGQILNRLRELQLEKKISTKEEALAKVQSWLSGRSSFSS